MLPNFFEKYLIGFRKCPILLPNFLKVPYRVPHRNYSVKLKQKWHSKFLWSIFPMKNDICYKRLNLFYEATGAIVTSPFFFIVFIMPFSFAYPSIVFFNSPRLQYWIEERREIILSTRDEQSTWQKCHSCAHIQWRNSGSSHKGDSSTTCPILAIWHLCFWNSLFHILWRFQY